MKIINKQDEMENSLGMQRKIKLNEEKRLRDLQFNEEIRNKEDQHKLNFELEKSNLVRLEEEVEQERELENERRNQFMAQAEQTKVENEEKRRIVRNQKKEQLEEDINYQVN